MSKLDTGGPAFPGDFINKVTECTACGALSVTAVCEMQWLDYAAIQIAQGRACKGGMEDDVARFAYGYAQALLAEKRRLESIHRNRDDSGDRPADHDPE